ncbi:HAMP domain-containing sensor histidine kinase [Sulfurovum sp. zt1-1]|uniref:histidine kinase n=1 Tax=Sulfurovum zhangzhouensis TaxID=3019067 RepID=A0ABT7QXP0_9BACT|nr:HAMP domain-containing sensor histidine kinase [Sulfurovum zhangzhouensis]MDM5271585.1 HAMP domain-containing sensor histidine kinase [Sulfurovum zhangzhouensis]
MSYMNLLPKTLKNKLLIALFTIGFLPYLLILLYSHHLGEKKILEDTLTTYHTQLDQTKKKIDQELNYLKKEVHFLASLDLMNDMIVEDIDKRIAKLLEQKQTDLELDIDLFALSEDGKIIATSNVSKNHTFFSLKKLKEVQAAGEGIYETPNSVIIFSPIYSSMQNNRQIGYLVFEYYLTNLSAYTTYQPGIHSVLLNAQSKQIIGGKRSFYISDYADIHQTISEKYLIIKEPLLGVLSHWSIIYSIDKTVALKFLNDFILFIWILFISGFLIIAVISIWISRRTLKPIAKLSRATKSITSTQDYTTQVEIEAEEEISELANDFNLLIRETNSAFEKLEKENQLRLLRFIQLIDIFNHLIQTQNEEECIKTAIEKLKVLMPDKEFVFTSEYPSMQTNGTTQQMLLYIRNFQQTTCDYYGSISILSSNISDDPYESKFYHSIATMIMLQLDQIRLIEQTKAVSHAKSTFISHMSHELRTPLHTILGSTQYLLAYENLTDQQLDKIATIEISADHLLGMINDVLDLVQIEAGKVTTTLIDKTSEQITQITKDVIDMLELLAEQKGLSITLIDKLSTPMKLRIDERFFKQILINLFNNAIKFTEKGSIECFIQTCGENLCIVIEDSGIGVTQEDLSRLFTDFTQAKSKDHIHQKGSGLGLAISKKLAHLFDADIILESRGLGYGTKATLILKKVISHKIIYL